MKKQRGFTFIEILVSVTIIAVLVAVGVVSYSTLSRRSRDDKRKSDLAQIRNALEQYRVDNGNYPGSSWVYSKNGPTWIAALVPKYMDALPMDPKNQGGGLPFGTLDDYGYIYAYNSTGQEYLLTARMESGEASSSYYGGSTWDGRGLYVLGEQ